MTDNDKLLLYYRDKKNIWYKEEFSKEGSFENIIKYNLSTLLNDEAKFNIDLNKDNNIGDVVDKIIANTDEFGIYKTTSGAFIKDESSLILVTHR